MANGTFNEKKTPKKYCSQGVYLYHGTCMILLSSIVVPVSYAILGNKTNEKSNTDNTPSKFLIPSEIGRFSIFSCFEEIYGYLGYEII